MLAYAHINLLSMLSRFTLEDVVRVATDSIFLEKAALYKLKEIEAHVTPDEHPRGYCKHCAMFHEETTQRPFQAVAPAQWRDKGENLYMPQEHAAYMPKPKHYKTEKMLESSTAPRYNDPLTRHQLIYLNGEKGSGKTTRAIELFRQRNSLCSHRLIV